jgi:hypothetical protein
LGAVDAAQQSGARTGAPGRGRASGAGQARPGVWARGAAAWACAAERAVRERREREKRERGRGSTAGSGGDWKFGWQVRTRCIRVWGTWAPSGPVRLGLVFFLFFFFKLRNEYLKSSKIPKKSSKLFINKILVFRLITIILFNYYIIY